MYELVLGHEDYAHPHSIKILNNFHGFNRKSLSRLESKRLIIVDDNNWTLTPKGFAKAREVFNQIKSM